MSNVDPDFYALLKARGASDADIEQAASGGQHFLNALAAELIVGPPGDKTIDEVALMLELPAETIADWWRSLGLADPSHGGVRFSDADIGALSTLSLLASLVPPSTVEDLVRVFGASAQQLAHAGVNALRVGFEQPMRAGGTTDAEIGHAYGAIVEELVPKVIDAWGALFRRHLIASTYEDVAISEDGIVQSLQTIAFVDVVDYTGFARRAQVAELSHALSQFESVVTSVAAQHGGRVVKLLGDGIMLRFAQRSQALAAMRAITRDVVEPPCRAGVATGPVLTRQGDFYGTVVNLAARLCGAVEAGECAVDASSPVDDADLQPPVALKGIDEPVAFWRLSPQAGG